MSDATRAPARPRGRAAAALLAAAVLALAGCGGPAVGHVSGAVTVDGHAPAEGSSITFVATDGKSPGGGAQIKEGRYEVTLPPGAYKVEVRVPEGLRPKGKKVEGPGPGGVADIKESLPAKYNDRTELTYTVEPGKNEKNWELKK